MTNRWLRFVLALLAITAIAAAGYRIFQYEQQLASDTGALTTGTESADTAIETVGELKAALHAYVAPGQTPALWTSRAATLLDKLRSAVLELDRATSPLGTPLTGTLDLSDRLAAAEQRAREHTRDNQPLLAGDVIFGDARDHLDAIRVQVAAARGRLGQAVSERHAEVRRQQTMLAVGAVAIVALALLALVPPVGPPAAGSTTGDPRPADPSKLDEYARVVPTPRTGTATTAAPAAGSLPVPKATPVVTPAARPSSATSPPASARPATRSSSRDGIVSAEVMAARSAAGLDPSHRPVESSAAKLTPAIVPVDRPPSSAASPEGGKDAVASWKDAAALCTDLAMVSDSQQISALLARAATQLNASGIVLWMASTTENELAPAASTGYDERIVSRIGTISREADNLTAAAFREATAKSSSARTDSAAALAVPLLTPTGPVGVLSAELREGTDVDPQRQALATILSAHLSMLLAGAGNASGATGSSDTEQGEADAASG